MSIERLPPVSLVSSMNLLNADLARISEDVDSDDGLWMVYDNPAVNNVATLVVAIRRPTVRLRPGAGLQKIRVRLRAPQAPPAPTFSLSVAATGFIESLQSVVGSPTGEVHVVSFDAGDLPANEPELLVGLTLFRVADGMTFAGIDIGSIEWLANTVSQSWHAPPDVQTPWKDA